MLRAERLGKRYGAIWAVRGVCFELGPGEALVVLGANGSGKSTLLKLLSGLIEPSEGTVFRAQGEPTRTVGYAAPDLSLYAPLTGREHLDLAARMRGVAALSDELLDKVGLTDAATRPCGEYSTGMRSRLKLALAAQAGPEVLLLDEPSASMDERGREAVACVVHEQLLRGVVVIATNDEADRAFATSELRL